MNEEILLTVNGQKLRGVLENKEGKHLVVLVHGFTGNWEGAKHILLNLSKRLQAEGFAVIRFSCRGTFPSEGMFKEMTVVREVEDLNAILAYARAQGYEHIHLLGESMGGALITLAYDETISSMTYWYAAFDFPDTDFASKITDDVHALAAKQGWVPYKSWQLGREFIESINQYVLYDELKKIKCPTIILHGDADEEVPVAQAQKAFDLLQSKKEIHILKGADHCFRNGQEKAIDLTVQFLLQTRLQ